jgi:TRAP-type C4-dicarboxylate transport system permease small subunit
MKPSSVAYLVITTFALVTVAIFAAVGTPYNWVFYLTVFGQVLLVFSIFKILTDHYTTDKTFEDFYEDHPIGRDE